MKPRFVSHILAALTASVALYGCGPLGGIFSGGGNDVLIQGERISIIAANQQLTADPLLADVEVELPPPVLNTQWPQPGETVDNRIGHLQAQGSLQQLWTASAGKGSDNASLLMAPPIVAEGRVYVLDAASHLHAFNADTGDAVWNRNLTPAEEADNSSFFAFWSTPERISGGGIAYDEGTLYAATGFGTVKALDPATGNEFWSVNLATPARSAPVVVDGRIYVVTQDNQLMVLNTENGAVLWNHRGIVESASIATSTNVAVSGDTVIVPYSSGELFALRVDNGAPYWTDTLTRTGNITSLTVINDIAGRPVVDRGMVFAVSHSGTLVAINIRSGGRVWTRNIPGIQTPLSVGEFLFIVSTEAQVLCISRDDGRIKWITSLPAFQDPEDREDPIVWTGPLLVANRLLLFSSDGRAVSIVPSTGQIVNQIPIPNGTFIPPIMANGTMYVLTNSAQLVALR